MSLWDGAFRLPGVFFPPDGSGLGLFRHKALERGEGFVADVVLDLAGVLGRYGLIDAQMDKEVREHHMALVGPLRGLAAQLRQMERAVVVHGEVAVVLQQSHGPADARLAVAHGFRHIDGTHKASLL